ncbi:hypothetical protein E2C01_082525 [Portunus trituberculatus]|uniref:Uncharacterized protein n=1 Tax=Portunus trituberculatus TaxID=210409 RepID=A0A5B7IZH8_PORTR|nr:hypothetical protein [Portunus trituberculatus]
MTTISHSLIPPHPPSLPSHRCFPITITITASLAHLPATTTTIATTATAAATCTLSTLCRLT